MKNLLCSYKSSLVLKEKVILSDYTDSVEVRLTSIQIQLYLQTGRALMQCRLAMKVRFWATYKDFGFCRSPPPPFLFSTPDSPRHVFQKNGGKELSCLLASNLQVQALGQIVEDLGSKPSFTYRGFVPTFSSKVA